MKDNIFPFQGSIKQSDRHCLNGHRSALVWFTGLSGSGKSTLAHALEEHLFNMGIRSYVLDGDNIRVGLNKDLGLSPEHRKENIRRIAEVSKLMVDSGILVIAAFIAPYRNSRMFVRELMSDYPFFECYVRCPVDVCETRDPKGLYEKARKGEITNMTGIAAPYEEPENPELVVDTNLVPLNKCVDRLIGFLTASKIIFSRSPNDNLRFSNP
ncbi:MAG TPA: adenylyl-sulfate kinase [Desulfobacterales bacterium]|nr:adenylyl-sulfate kinase [Desulfobacterales bacterium]